MTSQITLIYDVSMACTKCKGRKMWMLYEFELLLQGFKKYIMFYHVFIIFIMPWLNYVNFFKRIIIITSLLANLSFTFPLISTLLKHEFCILYGYSSSDKWYIYKKIWLLTFSLFFNLRPTRFYWFLFDIFWEQTNIHSVNSF